MNKEPMTHPERRALQVRLEDALYIVQLRQERKELAKALRYWMPKELPFPDQRADPVCQGHNLQWEQNRALLTKLGESA